MIFAAIVMGNAVVNREFVFMLQIPQLGCLHFTNCRYLAHELVALAYTVTYRSSTAPLGPPSEPEQSNGAAQSFKGQEVQMQDFLDVAAELNSTAQMYLDQQV